MNALNEIISVIKMLAKYHSFHILNAANFISTRAMTVAANIAIIIGI